jgi:hypothetical protein
VLPELHRRAAGSPGVLGAVVAVPVRDAALQRAQEAVARRRRPVRQILLGVVPPRVLRIAAVGALVAQRAVNLGEVFGRRLTVLIEDDGTTCPAHVPS